ncbi:hypothetical protein ACX8XN_09710 [Calditrichota bacterium GD2]
MKNLLAILGLVAIFFASNVFAQDSLQVQNQYRHGFKYQSKVMNGAQSQVKGFVDLNGDGYNDNAPDADGDGIPNGMDPDYTGAKMRKGNSNAGFVDLDGDGINDNAIDSDGDGIPNGQDPDYVRPQDGTGRQLGKGKMQGAAQGTGLGTGECDGIGPKGNAKRGIK